jgi:hypothetical protein
MDFSNIEGRVGNSKNFTQNSLCFSYLGPPVVVLANFSMRFECSGTNFILSHLNFTKARPFHT